MSTTLNATAFGFVERLAQDLQDARFELPAFPEAVLRVQRALQSADTSAGDIVAIMSSDPGLAARILRVVNSAAFMPVSGQVTDLRSAVSRLGFSMVRTVAVEYAMRQLRRKGEHSPAAHAEIEAIWRDSLQIASICYVIAKRYTRVNADQALLTGLMHGLGRLYIVMRAEETADVSAVDMREVADGWQAAIGKAILESWGLPEPLQHAVEHQDDRESGPIGGDNSDGTGAASSSSVAVISLTNVLVAAKVLAAEGDAPGVPALGWLNGMNNGDATTLLTDHDEEIQALRASLSE